MLSTTTKSPKDLFEKFYSIFKCDHRNPFNKKTIELTEYFYLSNLDYVRGTDYSESISITIKASKNSHRKSIEMGVYDTFNIVEYLDGDCKIFHNNDVSEDLELGYALYFSLKTKMILDGYSIQSRTY